MLFFAVAKLLKLLFKYYLFIQHLLSALFANKYTLMCYLVNTLQNKAINNFYNNQF